MRLIVADYVAHPFQMQLSRELARRGVLVRHVFAGGFKGPRGLVRELPGDPEGLQIRPLGAQILKKKSVVGRLRVSLDFGAALAREISSFRPDAVIASNVPPEALVRARFGRSGAVWIWWVQDLFALAARGLLGKSSPAVGWLASRLYGVAEAWLALRADGIVLISSAFEEFLPRRARGRAVTIRNWAPVEELPVRPKLNPWSSDHGIEGTLNFVYSGTLGLKHDPMLLVHLAEHFAGDPAVKVVVISEGPGADLVRREASARGLGSLMVLPFQPYERLPDVLASGDVLIVLLEPDAGPLSVPSKVLSYLCAGRAILGSVPRANLAWEIVTESGAGIVVTTSSPSAFAEAGARLINDRAGAAEMGRRGRAYAEAEFDIVLIADRFLQLIENGVTG